MTKKNAPFQAPKPRILLVDDNPAIHEDFRKILGAPAATDAVDALEAALFDTRAPEVARPSFEYDSVHQGLEAIERVRLARAERRPYALAFVDVRMPPGLDGIETIARLWEIDPDVQIVICTAFSDYSWSDMIARLGQGDRLLILKKPFDPVEVQQLAVALTAKWSLAQRERARMADVQRAEQEARAYAASLETLNRALQTTLATSEAASRVKKDFLLRLAHDVLAPLTAELDETVRASGSGPGSEGYGQLELTCADGGPLRTALADILDLCELEAGGLQPMRTSCDPLAIARATLEGLAEQARARGVSLRLEEGPGVPALILTDGPRLRRMLAHLVRSALRSTRGTEMGVRVELQESGTWRCPQVRFSVTRTGRDLSRSELARLFEPFDAPHLPASETPEGTRSARLALSVARRLARVLGGDLTVESETGTGSTFSLTVEARSPAQSS